MGKYIKPICSVEVESQIVQSISEHRFVQFEKLDRQELDSLLSFYKEYDVIHFDLKEFECLSLLRQTLIEEMDQEYPCKMDQIYYLDEAMESLDENYRMKWVIIIENWDCMDSIEYQRFLKSILKNGILNRGIKKVIVTGKRNIQEYGFTQCIAL